MAEKKKTLLGMDIALLDKLGENPEVHSGELVSQSLKKFSKPFGVVESSSHEDRHLLYIRNR